jgi:hypothetical protein
LNTVFAQKLLEREGKDWSRWRRYFGEWSQKKEDHQRRFYAATYFLMEDMAKIVSADDLRSFLSYAESTVGTVHQHINIDKWLASIPKATQAEVQQTIFHHSGEVETANRGNPGAQCVFVLPTATA